MRLNNRINWVLAGLLCLALFALAAPAWASDDDNGGGDATATAGADSSSISGADAVATAMSGDLSVGDTTFSNSSKTFAFSHSLGDVDINEGQNCLGSEAWGSFIVSRQTNELNPWCAALFYELNGKHLFAAKMRCDIKEIGKHYDTEAACWSDQNLAPAEDDHDVHLRSDDFVTKDELQIADEQINRNIETSVAMVYERLEALEQKPAPRPRIVQTQAPPPEQYSAEDKAYILGLYTKQEEEDE